jgi:diguanylate cyclase (GGDEF)-like protein/PAS domain S-box-containing protein
MTVAVPTPTSPPLRGDLFALLARTASEFIAQPTTQVGHTIDRTLQAIGELFDAHRCYVFELDEGLGSASTTHEWCAPGAAAQRASLQEIPLAMFPWWMAELRAGRAINLASLDDLPSGATAERALLEPRGVRSLLVVPLAWRGRLDGFVGVEHVRWPHRWSDEEVGVLRLVVSSFAQAFERRRLDATLQMAATVFQNAQEAIFVVDRERRLVDANPTFSTVTGLAIGEVRGLPFAQLVSERHDPSVLESMWEGVAQHGFWRGELWHRRRDGDVRLLRLTLSAVRSGAPGVPQYVGVFSDVTRLREQAERLEQMAYHDALTKLPNRVLLADRLQQALAQGRRTGRLLAVCYMDLDHFKPVNDTYGHEAGDRLLVEMARRLTAALRADDTVARLGGDEFVVLLPGLQSMGECEMLVDRLLGCLAAPFAIGDGVQVTLTGSIGVRVVSSAGGEPEALLRDADQALYAAKEGGRGRAHYYDPELDRQLLTRRDRIAQISTGLQADEMALYYQPIVRLDSGTVVGVEALVRWDRRDLGLLPPSEWLGLIEDHELIGRVGAWAMGEALAQAARWHGAGYPVPVHVNVSALELRDPQFVERVREALARHAIVPPDRLRLEVVEAATMQDVTTVSQVMEAVAAMGVQFALDDFGTGYSSLTYLRRLPARSLKVDRTFVGQMLDKPEDRAIVQGVLGLAQAFDRQAIAEGVETHAHARALLKMGCSLGQGYGIAPPMPVGEMDEWLRGRAVAG